MSKQKLNLWDRDFELLIDYDCYSDEAVTDAQLVAMREFLDDISAALNVLDKLKVYIEKSSDKAVKTDEIDNIFKYVMPKSIFVPRDEYKVVAILCDYRFDMEHGIAIVFENGKLKEIGTQDIVL